MEKLKTGCVLSSKYKVLRLLQMKADGYTAKEIGQEIGYTERTVETTLQRLRKFHGARSTAHLLMMCKRSNIIE